MAFRATCMELLSVGWKRASDSRSGNGRDMEQDGSRGTVSSIRRIHGKIVYRGWKWRLQVVELQPKRVSLFEARFETPLNHRLASSSGVRLALQQHRQSQCRCGITWVASRQIESLQPQPVSASATACGAPDKPAGASGTNQFKVVAALFGSHRCA